MVESKRIITPDYLDMLRCLTNNSVEYAVVGAYAMSFHGHVRTTGDIDIFVKPSSENSKKVYTSLLEFGAPMKDISEDEFVKTGIIYQIGVVPVRIDIINSIDGVSVEDAFSDIETIKIEDIVVPFISLRVLLKNKSATGRMKDSIDVEEMNRELKDKIHGKK
jgi:hypothetical protein